MIFAASALISSASAQVKGKKERLDAQIDGAVSPDQVLGKTFRITPDELPSPKSTPAVSNGPLTA
jgi:hypothetical protein